MDPFGEPNLLILDEINKQTKPRPKGAGHQTSHDKAKQWRTQTGSLFGLFKRPLFCSCALPVDYSCHCHQLQPAKVTYASSLFQPNLAYSPVTLISKGFPTPSDYQNRSQCQYNSLFYYMLKDLKEQH